LQISPNTPKSCSQHKILTRNLKPSRSYRKQTHTHIQRERERERERNNNNNKILTRNLKPTRTYRNKQTHTQREKQQQKSFLRSHKPNQPKFLPKISSPQDLTVISTHTHTQREKQQQKAFLCSHKTKSTKFLTPNLKSTRSYKEKHTHTHTQKNDTYTPSKEKKKTKIFPFLPHNQTKSKTQNKIFTHRREDRFKATTLQARLLILQQLTLFPKGKLSSHSSNRKKTNSCLKESTAKTEWGRVKEENKE
jgi:hypothetical protein